MLSGEWDLTAQLRVPASSKTQVHAYVHLMHIEVCSSPCQFGIVWIYSVQCLNVSVCVYVSARTLTRNLPFVLASAKFMWK